MEEMAKMNEQSLKQFQKIVQNFDNVENLFSLTNQFEDLSKLVSQIDSIIEINSLKTFLDQV